MKRKALYFLSTIFIVVAFIQCDSVTDSGPSRPPVTGPGTAPGDNNNTQELELISPKNQSTGQSTQLELSWRKATGIDQYHIQLTGSETFDGETDSLIVDEVVNGNSIEVEELSAESTYHWRVSPVISDNSDREWTQTFSFTTGESGSSPITADLLAPEDGVEVEEEILKFIWNEITGIDTYRYQLSFTADFSDPVKDSLVTTNEIEVEGLDNAFLYYWRVSPVPNEGTGAWSEIRSIGAGDGSALPGGPGGPDGGDGDGGEPGDGGAPVIPVSLVSPADLAANQPLSFSFEWTELPGVDRYQIQVASDQQFTDLTADEMVNSPQFDIDGLDSGLTYFWRVRADGFSDEGWSEIRQFETEAAAPAPPVVNSEFVQVQNSRFVLNGETFRFAGTNAYYLPNYEKLDSRVVDRAFDAFEEAGVSVVRMWAFYDGYDCGYSRNDPNENVIQTAPGEYSESALQDLDRVIAKGKERGMRFVLPFINYWDELGGICQYNTWAGIPNPGRNMQAFMDNEQTQKWFKDYINMLLNRVNTVTGVAYKDEPAIFAWQIMNEGRNRGGDPRVMRDWYQEIAQYIKSIDSNHLVTTGEDGFDEGTPSEYSREEYSNTYVLRAQEGTSYVMNIAIPEIDYGNAHWYAGDFGFDPGVTDSQLRAQRAWIKDHADIAASHGKPFVLDEYGQPGWGDSSVLRNYEDLWAFAEEIKLDGSLIWQLTADGTKCYEFGGNICYPGGRNDAQLFNGFRQHIQNLNNLGD